MAKATGVFDTPNPPPLRGITLELDLEEAKTLRMLLASTNDRNGLGDVRLGLKRILDEYGHTFGDLQNTHSWSGSITRGL